MELRWIFYGYSKYQFDYNIISDEADTVRWIFEEYISGKSLKNISEELTAKGVIYFKDKSIWSKQLVRRILENEHYMGDAEYPCIIDKEIFNKAKRIRLGKGGTREKDSKEIAYLKQICFCENCGKHFTRQTCRGRKERWVCVDHCRYTDSVLDDKTVFDKIEGIIAMVVGNPELLKIEFKNEESDIPRSLLIDDRNLKYKLNDISNYSFGLMQKTIYDIASKKFEYLHIDYSGDFTDKLISYVKEYSFINKDKIDMDFLKVTVSRIIIKNSGEFVIRFINGKEIAEKKEYCDGVECYE